MKLDNIHVTEEAIKDSLLKAGMTFSEDTNHIGNTCFFDHNGKEIKLPTNFNIFDN